MAGCYPDTLYVANVGGEVGVCGLCPQRGPGAFRCVANVCISWEVLWKYNI